MRFFSVAADFKTDTIDQYDKLNNKYVNAKIVETFGQISIGNKYGSGRPGDMVPKVNLSMLERYVKHSKRHNINFNYTFNALCLSNREFTQDGLNEINKFFESLYEIGITSVTIAIPALIDFLKHVKYKFEIKASTLCDITNANKAMAYKKLGADRIVVSESINRDFIALKNIRDCFGEKVEVILNVICHKDCIFKTFHQIQGAHNISDKQMSPRYYSHRCMLKRAEGIDSFLKLNWIRPEDLVYYDRIGIHYYKIQGRHTVLNGNPVKTVESYMKENYEGNLLELLDNFNCSNSFSIWIDNKKLDGFIEKFVKHPGFCQSNCNKCNYCNYFAEKCIDVAKANEILMLSKKFYSEYDQFGQMIEKIKDNEKRSLNT